MVMAASLNTTVPMMTPAPQTAHAHSGHSPSTSGHAPGCTCTNGSSAAQPGQLSSGCVIAMAPYTSSRDSSRSWHAHVRFRRISPGVSPRRPANAGIGYERILRVNQPHLNSPFLRACRLQPVPYTPVWFMRQAGRSLPEYHRVRAGIPMLESCTRPELVTEITLQPLRRYDADAAVLYSDIVVPLKAIGVDVEIKPGVGPVIERPFRTAGDVERLRPLEPADVPFLAEAVKSLVGELGDKPLIGFAGGPFTLASYLIE